MIGVLSFALRHRGLILAWTAVGTLVALVVALTTEIQFTAHASFVPNGVSQAGGLSRLTQQLGLSAPVGLGQSQRAPAFYPELLRSREVMDQLLQSPVEVVTADGVDSVDLVEHFEIPGRNAGVRLARTRRHLDRVMTVRVSPQTGMVTLSIRTKRPELSAAVVARLLDLMVAFDVESRQSQASAERTFAGERLAQLTEELLTAEDSLKSFLDENRQFSNSPQLSFEHDRMQRLVSMKQTLVTAMAQSYEQARIDEVRATPSISLIDEPAVPAVPNRRRRPAKVLFGLFTGVILGFGMALARDSIGRARSDGRGEYVELRAALEDAKGDPLGVRRGSSPTPEQT